MSTERMSDADLGQLKEDVLGLLLRLGADPLGDVDHALVGVFTELDRARAAEDARKALMRKHQWAVHGFCPECLWSRLGHKPGCAWAAAMGEE
jgi:hypothetical protein